MSRDELRELVKQTERAWYEAWAHLDSVIGHRIGKITTDTDDENKEMKDATERFEVADRAHIAALKALIGVP